MAFENRAALEAEIIGWLGERTDLIPKVPAFIAIAEETMNGTLRCRELHERALALLTEEFEYLPANFAAHDYLIIGDGSIGTSTSRVRLPYKTMQQIDTEGLGSSGSSDLPCAYSVLGTQIKFAPPPTAFVTPDGVDPDLEPQKCRHFELVYWARVSPLTAPESTNVVLQNYPSIYLFGALTAAEPYMVNDPRVQLWAEQYGAAVDRANGMDKMGSHSQMTRALPEYAP